MAPPGKVDRSGPMRNSVGSSDRFWRTCRQRLGSRRGSALGRTRCWHGNHQLHGKPQYARRDGIRAAIVHTSGTSGRVLFNQVVHNQEISADVIEFKVAAGDTLDFVVNFHGNLNNDQFLWAPVLKLNGRTWSAQGNLVVRNRPI